MRAPKLYAFIMLSLITCLGCRENTRMTAFENVHLVPMTENEIVANQTVVVRGDRIHQIGPVDDIKIPSGARIIDGQGAYLMPGLADMHVHLKGDWPLPQLDLYLANGVTTVRDLDGRDFMLRWREEINGGKRLGPTILASCPIIRGYEQNAAELMANCTSGYDCVKFYSYFTINDFKKAIHTAKKFGMYTIGHIPFAVGLEGAIAAGLDEIAHVEELGFELIDFDRNRDLKPDEWLPYIIDRAVQQLDMSSGSYPEKISQRQRAQLVEMIHKLQTANMPVCSTLVVDHVIVQKLFQLKAFLSRQQSLYFLHEYREALRQGKDKHQLQFKGNESLAHFKYSLDQKLLTECHRAGIPIVLGTDAGSGKMGIVPGASIHDELNILIKNGFSPYEAIATGTVNASKVVEAMTGNNDFGTIEVGKRADFILVDKNPLENILHIRNPRGVMAAGQWYEQSYLKAIVDPALSPDCRIYGNVMQVRRPGNRLSTDIEIVFHEHFPYQLPLGVDSIDVTITDSAGNTSNLELPHYRYFEQFRAFWFSLPASPASGEYTFTVRSKDLTVTAKDFQTLNRELPLPDVQTFSPAEGQTLAAKAPTFRWAPVEYTDGPAYYRLIIEDLSEMRVFETERLPHMISHTVPEGVLKPGQTYRYRIRVMDNTGWIDIQNRSDSDWVTIKMAEALK